MPLAFKIRKSAGIRITSEVHRRISAGNRFRAERDWLAAAREYAAALEGAPALTHIWIQLGHALKEQGDIAGAKAAYESALRLSPDDAEAHLQFGHAAKLAGDLTAAGRSYLTAARLAPTHPHAVTELLEVTSQGQDISMDGLMSILNDENRRDILLTPSAAADRAQTAVDALVTVLRAHGPEEAARAERIADLRDLLADLPASLSEQNGDARPSLIFDVSDLIAYFRQARSPSGIQRVQIETITSAIRSGDADVCVCCFQEPRDEWVEIPAVTFLDLCRLSLDGDPDEWTRIYTHTVLGLRLGEAVPFREGAFLINLGTSWWLPNYFLFVRHAKERYRIRYVPFVHDMIPIVRSSLCPPRLVEEFISWAVSIFEHADFYFANSYSTKDDLLKVASYLGHQIDPQNISVVPLDANFRRPRSEPGKHFLRQHGLAHTPYVLLVSTIEPRKNHIRAFEAWTRLLQRYGPRRVPKLVCVGQRGWMNEPIYDQMHTNVELRDHVHILSGIADGELAELYGSCLFTLYPSLYEGWGLPVTESLCHGKVPLASRISSIPEAGGRFADYFDVESTMELTAAIERLIFDRNYRQGREALIAEEFEPRSWSAIAAQITDSIDDWRNVPPPAHKRPIVLPGAFHPLGRNLSSRVWPGMRSAEVYRSGSNWWGRDDWGCWTKPGGAGLRFSVPAEQADNIRCYVRLQGLPTLRSHYRIEVNGLTVARGELRCDEAKWLPFDMPAHPDCCGWIDMEIFSDSIENFGQTLKSGDTRIVSIGVAGFFLCSTDDSLTRSAFLEAVAIGNVDDLSIAREPFDYERFF